MATMYGLIDLANSLQSACSKLPGFGDSTLSTLWDSLPPIVVIGAQGSGKSSVLESIVGRHFLPRGSDIVTRRPLLLQLQRTNRGEPEYAEFLHLPGRKFADFSMVGDEIREETEKLAGMSKQLSAVPIQLRIYSPNVANLKVIDLPGLAKGRAEGQPETIVQDTENMVRSYVKKPNYLILVVIPANQDIATSDAIKLAREVDQSGERTYGVITKLDLMVKGTYTMEVLEGRSYRLRHPWVGTVKYPQADTSKNMDMLAARQKEHAFFATSPEFAHLVNKMGTEYLAKLLSSHLEDLLRARIPSIISSIDRSVCELEAELNSLGRSITVDSRANMFTILELCRAFHRTFNEYLDGGRSGGSQVYQVFDYQLPAAMRKAPIDRHLSIQHVKKVVSEADGYQPHLVAPELAYRRLIDGAVDYFKSPAEDSVNTVHLILKELIRKSIGETPELRRFPLLQSEIAAAAYATLDRFREESKKTALRLVDMETNYLTVDFFRELTMEASSETERYTEVYFQKIASNVTSYVVNVAETLRNAIPKAIVHCQVRNAKHSLLDYFYVQLGNKQEKELGELLYEDPDLMEKRMKCKRRVELYKSVRSEIDSLASAW